MIKKVYFLLFIFILCAPITHQAQPFVTEKLQEQLSTRGSDDFIEINIRLNNQYDHTELYGNSRQITDRQSRRRFVINELKAFSQKEQSELISYLEQMQQQGKVKNIRAFWIGNMVHCYAKPEVISELSTRKDLARVDHNTERQVLPIETKLDDKHVLAADKTTSPTPAWNVLLVNAPEVWQAGYQGEEIVVAVLDSGVNYNHNDLAGRMWEHPDYPNHGYNFVNNNHVTMDYNSHGTHCAGTVAGNGTSGTITGMAPAATIMALKVLGDGGSGTEAGVWSAIEFSVEHGAHIMSLSLGWKHAWNPDRSMWRTTMNNALSAGVIASVAAGNEGTSWSDSPPSEVRTPGDIPPPWTNPDQVVQGGNSAVVSVGSTTNTDALSGFSSKGPVTWQHVPPFNDYPYPEIGLIRPDVTAPGSDITSLTHNNNSGYTIKSGTSMAAPAVAGIMALMLSKNPELTPEQINQILEETAIAMTPSKSNTFGSGRVDAFAAFEETPYMGLQLVEYSLDDSQGNNNGNINPGETILIGFTMENVTEEPINDVNFLLRIDSPYITLSDSIASAGDFAAGEVKQLNGVFSFEVANDIPGNHKIDFMLLAYEDQHPENQWRSRFSEQAQAPYLSFSNLIINDSISGNGNGRLDPGETAILRFVLGNSGSLNSDDLAVNIQSSSPFVIIPEPEYTGPEILAGDFVIIDFEVSVHGAMLPGSIAEFHLNLQSGYYAFEKNYVLKVGMILEDWQSGNFSQFDWQFSGNADWFLQSVNTVEGTYAAQSGTITHNSTTAMSVDLDVLNQDSIAFYRKVSSENNYDWLEFWIDDEMQARWSGNHDWSRVVFDVEPGTRNFRWVYTKDGSVNSGEDCAWIDMIEFPAIAMTSVFAGFDAGTCGPEKYDLDGFASYYDVLNWSTNGDGTFGDAEELNTWYLPGEQDLLHGQVTLTIEAGMDGVFTNSDSMTLSINPLPEVDLGQDILLCYNQTQLLDAGEGFASYLWFDGSAEQTYLIEPDTSLDEMIVWVMVQNEFGCNATDTIIVTFDECVGIDNPNAPMALNIYPNPASGAFTISWYNEGLSSTVIRIFTFSGQILREHHSEKFQGHNTHDFNVSDLKPGIYLVSLESQYGTSTRKIVITAE